MRPLSVCGVLLALLLSGCEGWPMRPGTYNFPTPVPSRTPLVQTVTPFIISPSPSVTPVPSSTETPAATETPASETPTLEQATITSTATSTGTIPLSPAAPSIQAKILGCEPSIDIVHGLGEVTNAYVTVSNSGSSEIPDLCATLNALGEGQPDPDKKKCVSRLPQGYQVTFKLTVDTTFGDETAIQIDITSGDTLLLRLGQAACSDLILVLPSVDQLDVPQPTP